MCRLQFGIYFHDNRKMKSLNCFKDVALENQTQWCLEMQEEACMTFPGEAELQILYTIL